MPSNVFIYQLPVKPAPISDTDLFIIEDMGTKQVPASALRNYFFDYLGEAIVPKLSTTEFFASSARLNIVDITNYELSGFKATGDLTVVGDVSATDIIYSKEFDFGSLERPSLTGVKQALDSFLYVPPAIASMTINSKSVEILEVGAFLTTPTIRWNSNKVEPEAVTQYQLTPPNGNPQTGNYTFSTFTDPNTYSITQLPSTSLQQVSSWTVQVTDWNGETNNRQIQAIWRYRVYYGVTDSATPDAAAVKSGAIANSPLATSRLGLGVRTLVPDNKYFYVAYPQRFDTTTSLKVNGNVFNDFTRVDIPSFVNDSTGTDSYYVYRSNNLVNATYEIEII